MRLTPSDPDIETLVGRMNSKNIDLQPDFQRGEIWSTQKKQKLIDSILRDWHVPPIHVIVEIESNRQLVLDGQQRLVSIRDFANGIFSIDGSIEPFNAEIYALNGKRFSQLSDEWKNRFNQFTIRVFRITDYTPSEPGELFYRLNQPSALTSAEQRNAFVGEPRRQIKKLVDLLGVSGLGQDFWGFSNARMAYDDMLARVLLFLENGSIRKKVTSLGLADKYRGEVSFDLAAVDLLTKTIQLLGEANNTPKGERARLNKATAQSWLLFVSSAKREFGHALTGSIVAEFLFRFESDKLGSKLGFNNLTRNPFVSNVFELLLKAYEDRSTSRVADVLSVQIRDYALWTYFILELKPKFFDQATFKRRDLQLLDAAVNNGKFELLSDIEQAISSFEWGDAL